MELYNKLIEDAKLVMDIPNPIFTKPECLVGSRFRGITKINHGVYGIYHISDLTKPYIYGMSNSKRGMASRKNILVAIFKNKGKALITNDGKHASDYPGARKLLKKDPDLKNWYFSYTQEYSAGYLEWILQHQFLPEFNNIQFAGY